MAPRWLWLLSLSVATFGKFPELFSCHLHLFPSPAESLDEIDYQDEVDDCFFYLIYHIFSPPLDDLIITLFAYFVNRFKQVLVIKNYP